MAAIAAGAATGMAVQQEAESGWQARLLCLPPGLLSDGALHSRERLSQSVLFLNALTD